MEIIILTIVVGLLITFFAIQNTVGVPLQLANYEFQNIPLYLIVIGAMLSGLLIAWVINIVSSVGAHMKLRTKDSALHNQNREIKKLEEQIEVLEKENARLRGDRVSTRPVIAKEESSYRRPSFLHRLRHLHRA